MFTQKEQAMFNELFGSTLKQPVPPKQLTHPLYPDVDFEKLAEKQNETNH